MGLQCEAGGVHITESIMQTDASSCAMPPYDASTSSEEQKEFHRRAKEIYRNYGAQIYWICLRFARDPVVAEDLRQDIFVKILRGLRNFKGESGLFSWIHSIAQNHCIDFARIRKRSTMLVCEDEVPYDAEPSVPSDEGVIFDRSELVNYLNCCMPVTKQIIQLHFVEGYSHQEVAGILGFRRNVVTRRIRNFTQRAMNYSPALGRSIS